MAFTTVNSVIRTAKLNYADSVKETLTSSDYVRYYTANKPLFDDSTTTVYKNNSTTSGFTVDTELGRVQFTTANNSTDSVAITYTYCDCSSQTISESIDRADSVITNSLSDTDNTEAVALLSDLLTSHLIFKGLAAKAARGGMNSYSIGFFNVNKGVSPALAMAKMFYADFEELLKKLATYKAMKMTWRQSGNDERTQYYNDRTLTDATQETTRLTDSPGMTYGSD